MIVRNILIVAKNYQPSNKLEEYHHDWGTFKVFMHGEI